MTVVASMIAQIEEVSEALVRHAEVIQRLEKMPASDGVAEWLPVLRRQYYELLVYHDQLISAFNQLPEWLEERSEPPF